MAMKNKATTVVMGELIARLFKEDKRLYLLIVIAAAILIFASWAADYFVVGFLQDSSFAAHRPPQFFQTLRIPVFWGIYSALGFLFLSIILIFLPISRWQWRPLLILYLIAVVLARWVTPDIALDLAPKPDAIHYAALAGRIITDGVWKIPYGPHELPSRFPLGPSLVMSLSQWIEPDHLGSGIWAIWVSGLLAILIVVVVGQKLLSLRAGLFAAILLSCSPVYAYFSRSLMGEVAWSLFVLSGIALIAVSNFRYSWAYCGGLLLGLAILFKLGQAPILLGVGCVLMGFVLRDIRRWLPFSTVIGAGVLTGLLPWIIYNHQMLGGWLISGYDVYDSGQGGISVEFGAKYLFGPPYEKGFMGNLFYYPLAIAGFDPRMYRMLFPFPVSIALLSGVFLLFKKGTGKGSHTPSLRLFFALAAGALLPYLAMLTVFAYQESRYLVPVLPLICLFLAAFLDPLLDRIGARSLKIAMAGLVAFQTAAGLAITHAEKNIPRIPSCDTWRTLAEIVNPGDILISDEDPTALSWYGVWRPDVHFIPLIKKGTDWVGEDPFESYKERGIYSRLYGGVAKALKPVDFKGREVLVFFYSKRRGFKVLAEELPGYELVEHQHNDRVPGLYILRQ